MHQMHVTRQLTDRQTHIQTHNLLVIGDSLLKVTKQIICVAQVAKHSTLCGSVTQLSH